MKLCHRANNSMTFCIIESAKLPIFNTRTYCLKHRQMTCIASFIIFKFERDANYGVQTKLYCQQLLFKSHTTFCLLRIEIFFLRFLVESMNRPWRLAFLYNLVVTCFVTFDFSVSLSMSFFFVLFLLFLNIIFFLHDNDQSSVSRPKWREFLI